MKLKEIVWEKSRNNSAVQSGKIGGEYVAIIKKIGKQYECLAGNGILTAPGNAQWEDSEQGAKLLCRMILEAQINRFCDGRLEISFTRPREFHVSSVAGEEGGDQVRQGGFYTASDLPEAVTQFIREKFHNGDNAPIVCLHLDKLEARRTS